MNKYLLTIKHTYNERDLEQLGTIIYKSILIQGLYGLETAFEKTYLLGLPFVLKIAECRTGSFDV